MIKIKLLIVVSVVSLSFTALSQKDIDFTLGYQGVSGTYSGDTLKKSISSNGFIINTTFLDDLTITHTSTKTAITNTVPANNIDQTSKFTTVGYNLYTDAYGMVNLRGDYQSIDNNDPTGATDNVSINSYQASVLPYDDSYYAEIGVSSSLYPFTNNTTYNSGLRINQLNATYGTSITNNDWLALKIYQIGSSDKVRTHNKNSFTSLEAKYKYFLPENPVKINNIELSGLLGERVFGVDGAAGSAYNMGDLQTGSLGLTAEWKLSEDSNALFSISKENYTTGAGQDYMGTYRYMNFNYKF